ncbi:MAG: DUF294 nucleotidyltransferase-like domain-containing protein [Thermodesulfovibrionales bacterium]
MIEIAEERFGEPPVPYCWIAFGSEGRKEQTFKTDQDNALIYHDPADAKMEKAVDAAVKGKIDGLKKGIKTAPAGAALSPADTDSNKQINDQTDQILAAESPRIFKDKVESITSVSPKPQPIFPLKNPGIFSMGAAFLVGILFSLFGREKDAEAKYNHEKIRSYIGIGAEE